VLLTDWEDEGTSLLDSEVVGPLSEEFPWASFKISADRQRGTGYYRRFAFEVVVSDTEGNEYSVSDGGPTDWTADFRFGSPRAVHGGAPGGSLRDCTRRQ